MCASSLETTAGFFRLLFAAEWLDVGVVPLPLLAAPAAVACSMEDEGSLDDLLTACGDIDDEPEDVPPPPVFSVYVALFLDLQKTKEKPFGGHVAPHGGRAAPLAAGARLIAAPTPRRRHLTQRGASRRRRQNRRELAARPRQQKHQPSTSPSLLVLSQAHTRATCARIAAFAPRRTTRTGSQSAQRRHAAAKRTTLTSWRCCGFGTS